MSKHWVWMVYRFWIVSGFVITAFGLSVPAHAAVEATCSIQEFEFKQKDWRKERGSIRVIGELFNGCADAVGAEVQMVLRDDSGRSCLFTCGGQLV